MMTFSHSDGGEHSSEFYLGDVVYTMITANPLVNAPIDTMMVHSLVLKQLNYEGLEETTDLMESTYNYQGEHRGSGEFGLNFELESVHFHASIEGQICTVTANVEIHYANGVVRRELLSRRMLAGSSKIVEGS